MDGLVQQALQDHLLNAAKAVEDQLDSQLHAMDNMDEEGLESLRQHRIDQMKLQAQRRQQWAAKGHGEYREVLSEKEFFSEMKSEARMVCHFFRNNWPCKVMDKHMRILALQHMETKFIKIDAEKSPFLVEKLKIWMLPTLACIKQEKTTDYIVGFDELGGKDDFSTDTLERRLCAAGVIFEDAAAAAKPPPKKTVRQGTYQKTASDEDSDFD